jgi:transcription initiation factor TFIID subunit 6
MALSDLPAESALAAAQSLGLEGLDVSIAEELSRSASYRTRQVVQDALKFLEHSCRHTLSCEDLARALRLRNVEPVFGHQGLAFSRALEDPRLFFPESVELRFEDILAGAPSPLPLDPTFSVHWLAVEGVQPAVPMNPTVNGEFVMSLGDSVATSGQGTEDTCARVQTCICQN